MEECGCATHTVRGMFTHVNVMSMDERVRVCVWDDHICTRDVCE